MLVGCMSTLSAASTALTWLRQSVTSTTINAEDVRKDGILMLQVEAVTFVEFVVVIVGC